MVTIGSGALCFSCVLLCMSEYFLLIMLGIQYCVLVSFTTANKTSTPSTNQLKSSDLGILKRLLHPISAFWVAIADKIGMGSHVPAIRGTPSNTSPPEFLRDLLFRWIEHGHSTLEILCQGLRDDPEIIGGAKVANILEKEFQNRRGF